MVPLGLLLIWAMGGGGGGEPLNLMRDLPGLRPVVTVDSTYPGYDSGVLADGRWIAPGQETTWDFGHPQRLGNAGNTWVSAATPGAEHWVEIEWPQPVQVGQVELWWSVAEWYPRAFRLERREGRQWVPLPGVSRWLAATERRSVLNFASVEVTALRILQHAGGAGERGLMGLQEIIVRREAAAQAGLQGVRVVSAAELRRLSRRELEGNLSALHREQPGAAGPVVWSRGEVARLVPALSDGDRQRAAALPRGSTAIGLQAPVQHVIESASLYFAGQPPPADRLRPEYHDGRRWVPVEDGLTVERHADDRRLLFRFEPLATRALRFRFPRPLPLVSELEVRRYLPDGPHVWPERLVRDNQLERNLLASGREPSFEQLASWALSMIPARALLGLKDAPDEIGVTWDGRLLGRETIALRFGRDQLSLADVRDTLQRQLVDGWRPGVMITAQVGDLRVRQTALVSFADEQRAWPALFLRVELEHGRRTAVRVRVSAYVTSDRGDDLVCREGCLARGPNLVLASPQAAIPSSDSGKLSFDLVVPPDQTGYLDLVQPLGEEVPVGKAHLYKSARFEDALQAFRRYWDELLAPAARVELPEARLNHCYRAVLAQLLINGDGDIMPYGAAPSVYDGALFGVEEGFAMVALAYWGLLADAQRYLDATYLTPAFLAKVEEYRDPAFRHQQYRNGLQPHYAVTVYRLGRDRAWIERHLPLLHDCAGWTIAQRRKTMVEEAGGRPLHWGLLPEWAYGGDIADVTCYALYPNFACWRGLWDTAWLMRDLGDRQAADRYLAEAAEYRQALDRAVGGAYRPQHDPPFLPLRLYADEPIGDDYYQLFAGLLLALRPFAPGSREAGYLTDYLERANLTFCGLPRFRRDVGAGGLDGIYGLGYVLTKLFEDKVEEFLLGFYGYLAFNLERDTFASRETNVIYASDLQVGARYEVPDASDPLPCASAVALHYLRHLLVTEPMPHPDQAPDTLWLLAGAPRAWFSDGERIHFRDLPTDFGPVSCTVVSYVSQGRVEATVTPPARNPWRAVLLRLRHPEGKRFRAVMVNGQKWQQLQPERELIHLPPGPGTYSVIAEY